MNAARLAVAAAVAIAMLVWPGAAARAEMSLPVIAEGPGIVVRAEAGLDQVAARLAERAPEDLARIASDLHGLTPPRIIEIRVVKQVRDIARAAPTARVPPWAVGVAFGELGVVVVALRREAELLDYERTTAHELAHMALDAALDHRAPRWLNEGFAYLHSSDWSFARFRTLVGMAWSNNVLSLAELDRSFPTRERAADRAYAQSYDFVAYLARRGRHADADDDGNRWPFRRFLAAIARGSSLNDAALHAYSTRLADLFDEWRRSLRSRYLLFPGELFAILVWIFGAFLLIIAYIKRRIQNRATLARWEEEEQAREQTPAP